MMKNFENYLITIGIRLAEFTYDVSNIFDNIDFFKSQFEKGNSPYFALTVFNYELDERDRSLDTIKRIKEVFPEYEKLSVSKTKEPSMFYIFNVKEFRIYIEDWYEEIVANIYHKDDIFAFGDKDLDVVLKKINDNLNGI